MKTSNDILKSLQKKMFDYYNAYRNGKISQSEYLFMIKPIDREIDRIECSVLKRLEFESR